MTADSGNRGLIIWPIAQRLFQSVMLQQRPRFTGGRRIPVGDQRNAGTRPTLPWDDGDRPPNIAFYRYDKPAMAFQTVDRNFALCALRIQPINLSVIARLQLGQLGGQPAVVHALKPMPADVCEITGVSVDNAGSPLANCTMSLFRVDRDSGGNITYVHIGNTVSDGSGNYVFAVNRTSSYRVTADNSTGPVQGISLNTLTGTYDGR
jgi:hypothetical protein